MRAMLRQFIRDKRGNFAVTAAIMTVPILGVISLAVDYAEMSRQKQAMLNALDATCVAAAREFLVGATEAETKVYAQKFYDANLGPVARNATTLTTIVPTKTDPRDTIECTALMQYLPFLRPAFLKLISGSYDPTKVEFSATSKVKVQNTVEVALVLDNSGSMGPPYSNRMNILKPAAKTLVDTLSARGALMKQVEKPVQFALVPFAASVNVGSGNDTAAWMDTTGVSPIHHQNFEWGAGITIASNKQILKKDGYWKKVGSAWGDENDSIVTRFSMFKDVRRWKNSGKTEWEAINAWGGCVEARPYPFNIDDTPATVGNPATMYVPMFSPDEHSDAKVPNLATGRWGSATYTAINDWWPDVTGTRTLKEQVNGVWRDAVYTDYYQARVAQRDMIKYFTYLDSNNGKYTSIKYGGVNNGPNQNCSTTPITELTDISTPAGATALKTKIDAMQPLGATDVPEGMAWGWRTLSSIAPFTGGRPEKENGNDKVVIVLTDGANTYYTPQDLGWSDLANNESDYSAYGYAGEKNSTFEPTRLFMGQPFLFNTTNFSMTNYTTALNNHFAALCDNVKASGAIVMTVALDLDKNDAAEAKQIEALKKCSSDSRFKKNPDDTPAKLFWNSTSGTLSDDFKAIGDELSNIRIVF